MDFLFLELKLLENRNELGLGNLPSYSFVLFHDFQNLVLGVFPPLVDLFLQNQLFLLADLLVLFDELFQFVAELVDLDVLSLKDAAIVEEHFDRGFLQKEGVLAEDGFKFLDVEFPVGPENHLVLEQPERVFVGLKLEGNGFAYDLKLGDLVVTVESDAVITEAESLVKHADFKLLLNGFASFLYLERRFLQLFHAYRLFLLVIAIIELISWF